MNNATVEILLATFNGEKYLSEQIDSILQQTYQDFRILVRDDGSTDSTISIIQEYIEKFPQKIALIPNEDDASGPINKIFLNSFLYQAPPSLCYLTRMISGCPIRSRNSYAAFNNWMMNVHLTCQSWSTLI